MLRLLCAVYRLAGREAFPRFVHAIAYTPLLHRVPVLVCGLARFYVSRLSGLYVDRIWVVWCFFVCVAAYWLVLGTVPGAEGYWWRMVAV